MTTAQRVFLVVVALVAIIFTFWPFVQMPRESLYSLYAIDADEINVLRGVALLGSIVAVYKALGR